jgi:hypothetical protein
MATGTLEAAVTCCHVALSIIEPSRWKAFHGLPRGADKEHSRQRALQLFPSSHHLLNLKKHHGRAESALIALYVGRALVDRERVDAAPVSAEVRADA